MKRFIFTIRIPLIAELINSILAQVLGAEYGFLVFPLVTAAIAFWAGFLIAKESWGSLAHAGWAGPFVLVLGVVIASTTLAISGPFSAAELEGVAERAKHGWVMEHPRLTALLGFVMSTAMIMPVAALISLLGGLLAKHSKKTEA